MSRVQPRCSQLVEKTGVFHVQPRCVHLSRSRHDLESSCSQHLLCGIKQRMTIRNQWRLYGRSQHSQSTLLTSCYINCVQAQTSFRFVLRSRTTSCNTHETGFKRKQVCSMFSQDVFTSPAFVTTLSLHVHSTFFVALSSG